MQENLQYVLAAIVESSDDAIVSKTLDGIITTWNKAAEQIFGYTAEEVIGKPISILIPVDRLNEEFTIIEKLKRGEKIDHYETIRRRKDGELINVSLTISLIKNGGQILGASKIARDITQTKQLEREMAKLAAIVESAPDPIITQTLDGVILSWNQGAEKLYGYSSKEVCGRHISMLFPDDYTSVVPKLLIPTARGESVNDFETFTISKSNRIFQVSLAAFPIKGKSGEILTSSLIVRDLTERKGIERERTKILKSEQ